MVLSVKQFSSLIVIKLSRYISLLDTGRFLWFNAEALKPCDHLLALLVLRVHLGRLLQPIKRRWHIAFVDGHAALREEFREELIEARARLELATQH